MDNLNSHSRKSLTNVLVFTASDSLLLVVSALPGMRVFTWMVA
jgi:hypothetical protein